MKNEIDEACEIDFIRLKLQSRDDDDKSMMG